MGTEGREAGIDLRERKMGLEEFGELLLRRRIVPERNAKYYVSWVRRFLGHAAVETTMIYTHVLNKPGVSVRSPLDARGSAFKVPASPWRPSIAKTQEEGRPVHFMAFRVSE